MGNTSNGFWQDHCFHRKLRRNAGSWGNALAFHPVFRLSQKQFLLALGIACQKRELVICLTQRLCNSSQAMEKCQVQTKNLISEVTYQIFPGSISTSLSTIVSFSFNSFIPFCLLSSKNIFNYLRVSHNMFWLYSIPSLTPPRSPLFPYLTTFLYITITINSYVQLPGCIQETL